MPRRGHPTDSSYYVYAYIDESGVVRYVGKGKGRRIGHHMQPNRKTRLSQAVASGKKFTFAKLEEDLTESQAFVAEKFHIAAFGREIDGGVLWNLTLGGHGVSGFVMPESTRKKLSEARKGKPLSAEHRKKLSLAKIGTRRSPEAVAKTSAANRGRKRSQSAIEQAAAKNRGRKLGPQTPEHIAKAAVGRKGRKLSFKTRGLLSASAMARAPEVWERGAEKNRKPIRCVETGEVFKSGVSAAETLGLHVSAISCVLNGVRKTTGGFRFEFIGGA